MTSLGNYDFKDQGGMCSLCTIFSWPYLSNILLPGVGGGGGGAKVQQKVLGPRRQECGSRNRRPHCRSTSPGLQALSGSHESSHTFSLEESFIHSCSKRAVIGLGVKKVSGKMGKVGTEPALHALIIMKHLYIMGCSGPWALWGFKFLSLSALIALLFITKLVNIQRKKFKYFPFILFLPSY